MNNYNINFINIYLFINKYNIFLDSTWSSISLTLYPIYIHINIGFSVNDIAFQVQPKNILYLFIKKK